MARARHLVRTAPRVAVVLEAATHPFSVVTQTQGKGLAPAPMIAPQGSFVTSLTARVTPPVGRVNGWANPAPVTASVALWSVDLAKHYAAVGSARAHTVEAAAPSARRTPCAPSAAAACASGRDLPVADAVVFHE